MDTIIYKLAGTMKAEELFLNVTANNIANVSTDGFKKQKLYFHQIYSAEKDIISKVCGSFTDFTQGHLIETKDKNDLAIQGEGFLTLSNGEKEFYTKTTKIFINEDGYMVDRNGYFLIGEKGKIKADRNFYIVEDGNIYDGNKNYIDKLLIFTFINKNLLSLEGGNYIVNKGGKTNITIPKNFSILQGYKESSNVDIMREMINLINVSRIYEAIQKNLYSIDYLYEKLIGTVR
ncbi:MAG: flagellar hook basal-body protein [bacterium]|nr:flagellar hook basal-body protein [bacterium]MDW8164329.1 flagellar hook basal-body protein [Candidatus Omnitrophota bacterium]